MLLNFDSAPILLKNYKIAVLHPVLRQIRLATFSSYFLSISHIYNTRSSKESVHTTRWGFIFTMIKPTNETTVISDILANWRNACPVMQSTWVQTFCEMVFL